MEKLSRLWDLVLLNLLTLVCCLPVITIGAALTGMHYVLHRMVRNEEGYVVPNFFKSFRQNFLQATGMWLLFLVFAAVFYLDIKLTGGAGGAAGPDTGTGSLQQPLQLPSAFRWFLWAGGIYVFLIFLYAFPLLARFQNTVFGTLRNAAILVVAAFPRTLAQAAVTIVLPLLMLLVRPLFSLLPLCGMSVTGYLCALLYSPVFKKIESRTEKG